jgi:hypothetical protein
VQDEPLWPPLASPAVTYVDRCGIVCQDLDLPDHLDESAAATLLIIPGRCVVLRTPNPWLSWTPEGVQTLAWRIAGRVPVILDHLDVRLVDDLQHAFLDVLDWRGAAA